MGVTDMNQAEPDHQNKDAVLGGETASKRDPSLEANDVISVSQSDTKNPLIPNETFKASQLENNAFSEIRQNEFIRTLEQGVEADVLSPNQPWRRGKVKLKIECKLIFEDEEESE